MYFVICQNNTWRVYRKDEESSCLSGRGETETAIEISKLYDIVLSEFYNLPALRAA